MNLSFLQGRLGPTLRSTDNVASRAIPIVFCSTRSFQIRIDSCLPEPSQRKTPDCLRHTPERLAPFSQTFPRVSSCRATETSVPGQA
jgi:hypothetical protein